MYYYGRLRDLREDADLTQKDVGKILNTTQQQLLFCHFLYCSYIF